MAEVKIMVVPGKIARVEFVAGMTVLDACEAARRQIPGVDWTALAKDREVRVQNRKFGNTAEVPAGYFGSIQTTPLKDGEVILILTKIKGNAPAPGEGVLTCVINGVEYALETAERIDVVLAQVVGYDLSSVRAVYINGEDSPFDQLVGAGDEVEVHFYYCEEESEGDHLIGIMPFLSGEGESSALAETPAQAAEVDPDQLLAEAARLEEQAEALRDLAEAIREVKWAEVRLAQLAEAARQVKEAEAKLAEATQRANNARSDLAELDYEF